MDLRDLFPGRAQPRRARTGTLPTVGGRERDEAGHPLDRRPAWTVLNLALGLLLASAVVAILNYGVPPPAFKLKDRAHADLTARVDFSYYDPEWLEGERNKAAEDTPPVFRQDSNWKQNLLRDLKALFEIAENAGSAREARAEASARDLSSEQELVAELYQFNRERGTKTLSSLLLPYIESVLRVISPPAQEGRPSATEGVLGPDDYAAVFRKKGERGEILRIDLSGREKIVQLDQLKKFQHAKSDLEQYLKAKSLPEGLERGLLRHLFDRFRPNLIRDEKTSEERRQRARDGVPDKPHPFRKGELLLAKDKLVNPDTLVKLREEGLAFKAGLAPLEHVYRLTGLATLALAVIFFHLLGLRRMHAPAAPKRARLGLALTCLAVLAGAKALMLHELPSQLAPVAFAAGIASLAFHSGAALMTALSLSFLIGFAAGGDLLLALALMVGALVSALPAKDLQNRWDLLRYGVRGGLAQGLTVAGLSMLGKAAGLVQGGGPGLTFPELSEVPWAVFNGVACGLFLLGSLPLVEAAFGIITNTRLIELCDQNQPALRKIMLEAPGTWAHTLQVAFLSEPAAEAIRANARLVRAGVYYHDLGKTLKPEYFVENQLGAEERHRRLAPSVSTLIITAHVKDGIELAREFRLPSAIIDFIPEHHGTTLVSYFYHSARLQAHAGQKAGGTGAVQEAFFRYPGPKPRSRETAIVMLADTVEAATRTLESPSSARLRAFVHELIMNKLLDGQLDECDLTFRDLAVIEEVFLRVLASRFHGRIRYPGQEGELFAKTTVLDLAAPAPVLPAAAADSLWTAHPAASKPPASGTPAAMLPAAPPAELDGRLSSNLSETKVVGRKPASGSSGNPLDEAEHLRQPGAPDQGS